MRFEFLVGYIVEALIILLVAKLARDQVMRGRGQDVNEMVATRKSVAAATSQAGYLIGVLLGFLGAISVSNQTFLGSLLAVALAGVVAIVLQLVADLASDKLIFRGTQPAAGAVDEGNVALAVGKAAVSIATGLVLRGAMSDPEAGLITRVVWFVLAQGTMVAAVLAYCRFTPYDDLGEIKRNNLAAGFPIAGLLLSVGLVMEVAIAGRGSGSVLSSIFGTVKFLVISLVLVYLIRRVGNLIMLPKVKLAKAIVDDKNVAAGIQEGLSFLLAALIVTFFLT